MVSGLSVNVNGKFNLDTPKLNNLKPEVLAFFIITITFMVLPVTTSFASNNGEIKKSCKVKRFKSFFKKYSENIDIQKKHTQFPLTLVKHQTPKISHDYIEYKAQLERGVARFPLILNKRGRKNAGLNSIKIVKKGKYKRVVSLYKADTDYQIDLYFSRKNDKCWYLNKIDSGMQ